MSAYFNFSDCWYVNSFRSLGVYRVSTLHLLFRRSEKIKKKAYTEPDKPWQAFPGTWAPRKGEVGMPRSWCLAWLANGVTFERIFHCRKAWTLLALILVLYRTPSFDVPALSWVLQSEQLVDVHLSLKRFETKGIQHLFPNNYKIRTI